MINKFIRGIIMNFYVDKIQKFFQSIAKYFSNSGYAFSWMFIIFVGAFALTTLIIIISSSYTYECVLTRAIDKINKFLSKNPRINDDNLITFNNKMKERGIPKVLRRQWQQFMLYREHEASYYMSFKHCVENPLKNSTYNQQMGVYRVFSFIFAFLSILLGVFTSYETSFRAMLQDVLIIPIIILVLYWLISMILNLIHNATTGDLYQNYQYFEINIDKATMTLPEYVDYEVLFTQQEIKKGIPVLFEYIQKRAIEEQQELEKARIKNVEHEKFNFDESGIDASLVLERSMAEAESYIATRKKFMQDIEQVNTEISQLENQYRENVKENQRLMQTSKESLDGLKKQLEQASSSIETNYIKKQMKDEVNRQQVAERDFDAMTEKYNQEQKNMQAEITRLQGEIDKAKKSLESNMMSEFSTYSNKIYKKLEEVVGDDQKEVVDGYKKQINELEEKLSMKDQELDNVYNQYQSQVQQMEEKNKAFDNILKEKDDFISSVQEQLEEGKTTKPKSNKYKKNKEAAPVEELEEETADESYEQDYDQQYSDQQYSDDQDYSNEEYSDEYADDGYAGEEYSDEEYADEQGDFDYQDEQEYDDGYDYTDDQGYDESDDGEEGETVTPAHEDFNYLVDDTAEERHENQEQENNYQEDAQEIANENADTGITFNYLPENVQNAQKVAKVETADNKETFNYLSTDEEEPAKQEATEQETTDKDDIDSAFDAWLYDSNEESDSDKPDDDASEKVEETNEDIETSDKEDEADDVESFFAEEGNDIDLDQEDEEDDGDDDGERLVDTTPKPRRPVGRPRKVVEEEPKEKRKVGRPKKVVEEEPARRVGRPKRVVEDETPTRRAGRPKKETTTVEETKRSVGRPAKAETTKRSSRGPGRPRKVGRPKGSRKVTRPVGRPKTEKANPVGRPKKTNPVGRPKKTNPVGRPRKNATSSTSLNDIDKKLKELNEQIKKENQNLAKTKKQLEKASIKKSKK